MSKRLLHTPEGVRDIYGAEYKRKLKIESLLHDKFLEFGYEDIQTPTFEFFDVFSKEIGTTPSKDLYKFFDKEGNTLVLRPDFTPSIARCAAKYFMESSDTLRFSYIGSTYTNTPNLQGKLNESTEMGAELIGDDSIQADAEIIAMVCESLFHTGLSDFQISIGNVEFFKGLCANAGIDEETELMLREYISGKNYFAAEDLLHNSDVDNKTAEKLLSVTNLFGHVDVLDEAMKIADNSRSKEAITRLQKLYSVLALYGVDKYISFDMGMLSKYNYYTGVIFKGYTYGVGDAIVKGGRYDKLLTQFGKNAPAVGFVILVDALMSAIYRQDIPVSVASDILTMEYTDETYEAILKEALKLRHVNGTKVKLIHKKD